MENILDDFRSGNLVLLGIIIVLFIATWLMLWGALKKIRLETVAAKTKGGESALHLRLQAYERLVLLLERIRPSNLLGRMQTSGLSAQQLQAAMVQSIRSEFDHNLTQQMYVSEQSWQLLHRLVEQSIAIINNEADKLSLSSKGTELAKNLIERISELNDDPYQSVLSVLREEAQNLLK